MVSGFRSLDALKSFIGDPGLKEATQLAGVIGAPRFEIYEEVEAI